MLRNLYVKNLALIDEIEVEFEEGLNILTGETGAGKSIILGSINLALGGKYSADMLRSGTEYGYVELTFSLENEEQIELLKEKDIFLEDGMLTLSRKLMDRRSVSKINGETVSASVLKEVAGILIDIHGQHEHQSLLYKKNYLTILDEFAKEEIKDIKELLAEEYRTYKRYKEELSEANLDERERNKEAGFLEFEINEICESSLKEGEDELLEEQYRHMVNGQKITSSLEEAYGYTGNESVGNAGDALSRAVRCLSVASTFDNKASELYGQLSEIESLLSDFNRDIVEYIASLEFSQEDFYEVEKRLNEINHLKSKYGNSIEEILTYCKEKEEKLETLRNYDIYLEKLGENLKESELRLRNHSEALSEIRKTAAKKLANAIREGLTDLNFLDVKFEIVFSDLEEFTLNGTDEVEFMISLNPGEPVRALGDVVSGGELSRIMLAIKTVLAEKDRIETLIFDEIDVGISGRTAQKVSEKMAVIGRNHQVICITHLAQIAAMADAHYAIEKQVRDGKTTTEIFLLDEKQEIEELARILGGVEITDTVLKNAAEMKQLAKCTK